MAKLNKKDMSKKSSPFGGTRVVRVDRYDLSQKLGAQSNSPVVNYLSWDQVEEDPELSAWMPVRSEMEFNAFLKRVEQNGIETPLDVWEWQGKMIVVDGHTRRKAAKILGKKFQIKLHYFKDKEEAKRWMIDHQQVDRRNLTPWQTWFYIGYEYNARKLSREDNLRLRASIGKNPLSVENTVQNTDNQTVSDSIESGNPSIGKNPLSKPTSVLIAEEFGVEESTVRDCGDFTQGVLKVIALNKELGMRVRDGKENIKKSTLVAFAKLTPSSPIDTVEDIVKCVDAYLAEKNKPKEKTSKKGVVEEKKILNAIKVVNKKNPTHESLMASYKLMLEQAEKIRLMAEEVLKKKGA